MTDVIVDAELRAKLHNLDGVLRVCDETGRVLGYFHPGVEPSAAKIAEFRSPLSDEEVERLRSQRTGRPLSEILAELGSS